MSIAAVIVAAGRGTRAGAGPPKQWRRLAGRTVAGHAIATFAAHPLIDRVVLVVHPDDAESVEIAKDGVDEVVLGGDSRSASVRAGLAAVEGRAEHVLIHDAARPLVTRDLIDRVIAALAVHEGAAPALAVTDALWRGADGQVTGTEDRTGLYRAQTPQGFDLARILAAHRRYEGDAADDVEIARAAGMMVAIVEGDRANIKITTREDFAAAERLFRQREAMGQAEVRVGNGYDVHRFGTGDHVVLCGVRIPHARGLQGHSDADVAMHAITDALLGAMAEGDIGRHFPPTDPRWKDAASEIFLRHAADRAAQRGLAIASVDCTVICENPRIGPHADAMRREIARILSIQPGRVSVKATTSERLGFAGREEGIAACATATLVGS